MVAADLVFCIESAGCAVVFVIDLVIDFVVNTVVGLVAGSCSILRENLADVTGLDTHAR